MKVLFLILMHINLSASWFDFGSSEKKVIEIKAPTMNTMYEQTMAKSYLNAIRSHSGMSSYYTNKILDNSAYQHANYLIHNKKHGHFENLNDRAFYATSPKNRMLKAGYLVSIGTENITSNSLNYKDSIDGLFSAIYHRFGFLDFQSDEIGVAVVQNIKDTNLNRFVYNMGNSKVNNLCKNSSYTGTKRYVYKVCKDQDHRILHDEFNDAYNLNKASSKKIVIYPYDNQSDIPPAFYKETPDPLPNHDVSGFPISIQFNDYYIKRVKLLSFKLYTDNNKEIKNTKIMDRFSDPHGEFKKGNFALFPLKRLEYDSSYKVVVHYEVDKINFEKIWHFHTRKFNDKLITIKSNNASITIKPATTYNIYFEPMSAQDILGDIQFPADLKLKLLDQNTIQIKLLGDNHSDFDIKSADKLIRVKIY